jgi:hypothetical protein
MIEVIFLLLMIIMLVLQLSSEEKRLCPNISGIYTINQSDLIYKYDRRININIEKVSDCEYKIINVKSKSLLNDFYEETDSYLDASISIVDNELKGGREIIYTEKVNNNFIRYKGYLNKNDIYIKKDNLIVVFKKV